VDENKHHVMKARDLYTTQEDYYENYPLPVFWRHIEQEEQRRKFVAYLKKKQDQIDACTAASFKLWGLKAPLDRE
jgi:hypothetical protein